MQKYLIAPVEDWVNSKQADVTEAVDQNSPFYFFLVDYQDKVDEDRISYFKHTVEKVNDASRIEDASLNLYELQENNNQVIFHHVDIIRKGERFSVLDEDKISVTRREVNLEKHITNNRETVSFSIDDLRLGDIIDLAMTEVVYAGEHPLNGKYYYNTFWLNWGCPVYHQHVRLINNTSEPLLLQHCTYESGQHSIKHEDVAPGTEWGHHYQKLSAMMIDNLAPSWLWVNHLLVTSATSWPELSAYLFNFYNDQGLLNDNFEKEDLDDLALGKDTAENIIKIVRFVQNEVRYKGENFGIYTHTPKAPEQTLGRRYGDCKDKSNLMVALLKHIGVNAQLTLVNTSHGNKAGSMDPSPFHFNHMIVHVEFKGQEYYFDPTIKKQGGDLKHCAQLDYGYGLVLAAQGGELKKLPYDRSQEVFHLKHIFDFSQGKKGQQTLMVKRKYYAHRADNMRYYLQSNESSKLEEDFLGYAKQDTDLDLTTTKPLTLVNDDVVDNMIELEEIYTINKLEETNKDGQVHVLTPIYLDFPVTKNDDFPLRIELEGAMTHDVEARFKKKPFQGADQKKVENAWLEYSDNGMVNKNTLFLTASGVPKKAYVSSGDLDAYRDGVEQMRLRSCNNIIFKSKDSLADKIGHIMMTLGGTFLFFMLFKGLTS